MTPPHVLHREHHSFITVILAWAAIGTDRVGNIIPLLLFMKYYLATAVVYLLILWSLPSNGSKYQNIVRDAET